MRKTISLITSCAFLLSATSTQANPCIIPSLDEKSDIGSILGKKLRTGFKMDKAAEFIKSLIDEVEEKISFCKGPIRKEGVLSVDMETAALFSVGKYRDKEVAGINVMSIFILNGVSVFSTKIQSIVCTKFSIF